MKKYTNFEMNILEMEEEVVRTSGLTNAGQGTDVGSGNGDGESWGGLFDGI